jgi:rhodanese-related sulfurtransferase
MISIDADTLRTWLAEGKPVTVLDVRPVNERSEWAIPGSRSEPLCNRLT